MALHLPNEPLKTHYDLEPAPRIEPVPISPLADNLATAPLGLV